MSEKQAPEPARVRVTELSLAVKVVDTVTGGKPVGTPRVALEDPTTDSGVAVEDTRKERDDADEAAVENPSGYYLFLDRNLLETPVTVTVDGGERYLNARTTVVVSDRVDPDRPDGTAILPPSRPAVTVDLVPSPAYPFRPGMTVLRGHVLDAAHEGISGAEVSIRGCVHTTETDGRGEFVLLFAPLFAADVERPRGDDGPKLVVELVEGKKLVKIERDDDRESPTLEVNHNDYESAAVTREVEEGTETVLGRDRDAIVLRRAI